MGCGTGQKDSLYTGKMNREDLFAAGSIVGDYGETPKPEPGVEERLDKFQVGGRRKRQTRKSKSRRRGTRHYRYRTSIRHRRRRQ